MNEIKEHLEEENQAWGLGLVKTLEKENEELKAMFEIVCKERYGDAWELKGKDDKGEMKA